MIWKRLPLPVFFIVMSVFGAAIPSTFLAVRTGLPHGGIWDHPRPVTFILLGLLALGMATVGTILEARQRKRGRPHVESRYHEALRTGQISGDVTGWADRVRRQLRFDAIGWLGVAYLLGSGGLAVVNGPRWAAVAILVFAVLGVREQLQRRRRLKALLMDLASAEPELGASTGGDHR